MIEGAAYIIGFVLLLSLFFTPFLLSLVIRRIRAKKKIKKYSLSVPGKIVSYRYETEWVDNIDSERSKFNYLSVTFDYFYQGVWYRVTKTYNHDISIVGLTDVTAIIDPKTMDVDILELVNQNITLPANKRIALIMIFTVIFGLPLICLPVLFLCVLFSVI